MVARVFELIFAEQQYGLYMQKSMLAYQDPGRNFKTTSFLNTLIELEQILRKGGASFLPHRALLREHCDLEGLYFVAISYPVIERSCNSCHFHLQHFHESLKFTRTLSRFVAHLQSPRRRAPRLALPPCSTLRSYMAENILNSCRIRHCFLEAGSLFWTSTRPRCPNCTLILNRQWSEFTSQSRGTMFNLERCLV